MPNVAGIISSHNKTVLASTPQDCKCNCRVKSKCQEKSIVYKAVVKSTQEKKEYIGLTEHAFKQMCLSHQTSFRHQKYEQSTELSKHIWSVKKKGETYNIEWESPSVHQQNQEVPIVPGQNTEDHHSRPKDHTQQGNRACLKVLPPE